MYTYHFSVYNINGVAMIFVWGATRPMSPGTFDVISWSRPDSVGGGVVAEMFRDLHKADHVVRWGGGVVADIFFARSR